MSEQENPIEALPPRLRKRPKKLLYAGLAVLLVIVIILIYYLYTIFSFASNIQEPPPNTPDVEDKTEATPEWEGTERVNILLMGTDSRGLKSNEKARSDSMIIVSIDPVSKEANLFSILRDTYAAIPGHGKSRMNEALALDGPALAMQAASDFTGLPIQYFVSTDFEGFIALIDALGGIEFEVEKRMYYRDSADDPRYYIDLKPGLQHMDGLTALQYVRFRHDQLSDYTRTGRQREFLSAVARKLTSTTSLLRLPSLLSSIEPHIRTNINIADMLKLARLGLDIDTETITSVQIPPTELLREEKIGGADVITVRDEDKLRAFIQEQLAPPEPEPIVPINPIGGQTP